MPGKPAARFGDSIVNAADIHIVMIPSPGGPMPTPEPCPFNGRITQQVSRNVFINKQPAALQGSMANNLPPHIPQGGPFQKPPTNLGRILLGSTTVRINGRGAARAGDPCETCHDLPPAGPQAPLPMVVLNGPGNVLIG
ncbi:hypothetical protein EO087_14245 [Dyella sp. M7H15-1]|uniref:PAAR domain-containing protein n=1 Tax=Dyella sp. M7H15-1 TaxID=2501295 RepID=UPI001004E946|nr:PAAR domain-containing protein [Dyella sp. M7H15-1]QAU25013.1 hypothetical protein EO087_14245 [Dyella sp. M7H15-1]